MEQLADSEDVSSIVLDQADRLFADVVTAERLTAADRGERQEAIWKAVEQSGFPLALVPESQGGVGLSPTAAFALIRRSAYHAAPVPLAETMIGVAAWAQVSGGIVPGAVTLAPTSLQDAIRIERSSAGYVLHGTAARVPWGAQAGHILLYASGADGSGYVALVPHGGARVTPYRNLASEPRDTLTFEGVRVSADSVRSAPREWADGLLLFGALIRAQQLVGAMERCLDHAVRYAMERKQFGRAIGKFQAVQMMLAEAAGQYAAASAAADLAAEAYGGEGFDFAVAVAKARCGEAAGKVAEISHQVHGAMGFTQEHPLHFATRRLWSWRDEFGHEPFWQERIGRLVCRGGGEALWPMLTDTNSQDSNT